MGVVESAREWVEVHESAPEYMRARDHSRVTPPAPPSSTDRGGLTSKIPGRRLSRVPLTSSREGGPHCSCA